MIRFCDLIFSGFALLCLSPLLLLVCLVLRVTGEGEVFFRQQRIGKDHKRFGLLKFATMLKNSPSMGTGTVTMKNDPRVLPVGRFLRRSKINEIPQLLNVLVGDMSLIGPRPQAPQCFDAFPVAAQEIIVKIKPGLSGIGPVIFRGEEDILEGKAGTLDFYDTVIAPYKGEVESWYVERVSAVTYFALIFVTVWVVCFPKTDLVWRIFPELPEPPDSLKQDLRYPA